MDIIKDSIEIKTTPEKAFNTLIKVFSSQNYFREWHKDHIKCCWIEGKPFEEGSILYVEEYLHGKLHKMRFQSTRFETNRNIEYKLLFPMSILCSKGSFSIEERGESCIFTATIIIRFGWLISKIAKKRAEVLRNHMKEEGESLKRLLEQ